jgi:hypothetical protein
MRTGIHADRLHVGARHAARPWVESLARAGYAAKGVLYVTIGALALMLAFGESGGRTTDSQGALRAIGEQPFGQVLLVVMAVGLAGHALWRTLQGVVDPEGEARAARRPWLKRASFLVRAVLHAGLVVYAMKLALGDSSRSSGAQSWSARVMNWEPLGVWLVALAGLVVVGVGLNEIRKATSHQVVRKLALERLSWTAQRWIARFGRFGTAARGAVFALAGAFLVVAAATADPGRAKGLGDTLGWLAQRTYGDVLLLLAALGLVAYGLYQLVVARYRAIRPVP